MAGATRRARLRRGRRAARADRRLRRGDRALLRPGRTADRDPQRPPPAAAACTAPERRRAPPFAFTAGRLWDEGKNLRTIDRAAGRLAGSVPVLAAGPTDGPGGARIALHHARPLGRLRADEIARRLAERPIFVSAARYEPFGLSVLEAAQAGCALVLSDIPTFRELWDGAADFVPADDDRALAAAIERAARGPAPASAPRRERGPTATRSRPWPPEPPRCTARCSGDAPPPRRRRRPPPREARLLHPLARLLLEPRQRAFPARRAARAAARRPRGAAPSSPRGPGACRTCCGTTATPGWTPFARAYPDLSSRDLRAISARSKPRWTAPTR